MKLESIVKHDSRQSHYPRIRIAIFCGGRGSTTIIHELLRWPDIELSLIVNAYDDGLSTGALRGFIPDMLGPSDFRKNLSYLIDPYSIGQYALKSLLEFRLPTSIQDVDIKNMIAYANHEDAAVLMEPLHDFFAELVPSLSMKIREYLSIFFSYAEKTGQQFEFQDCSMGNLIFAGAYLLRGKNFNATTKELSQLVGSRALLINVSKGENRILVGLKEDGEILANEAEIVGEQSNTAIKNIYLLSTPITSEEWQLLSQQTMHEKEEWLKNREKLPHISDEASEALENADIIIFGPGTQHSSLFPSYRIAEHSLKCAPASVKAFIMNLEADHDMKTLSKEALVDRALFYLGAIENTPRVITHIVDDNTATEKRLPSRDDLHATHYKDAVIVQGQFVNTSKNNVHNGRAVIEKILNLWRQSVSGVKQDHSVDIFMDIHKRSLAIDALADEFLEIDWKAHLSAVSLTMNQAWGDKLDASYTAIFKSSHYTGIFPEVDFFTHWLKEGTSEYLVLLTGDGEYRFRDVLTGIRVLDESQFGVLFGSRTQSRMQFKTSIRAAYGDRTVLRLLSSLGAFLISTVYMLRFGLIFSDPMTGFRIFKRSRIIHSINEIAPQLKTPVAVAKYLIRHKIEIAELPVHYRTFSGFTDPYWRIRRGLKNLISILS